MVKEVKYRGKLISLVTHRRRLPNGHVAEIEVIEHPGAVLIVPFLSNKRIILLYQYRPVIRRFLYELPAGTLRPKEKPLDCASRELIEETGYRASRMTRLSPIYPVPGYSTEVITLFKAEGLSAYRGKKDPDEIIKTRILDLSQVRKLFHQGKIMDAKTISALAFCGWL